MKRNLTRSFEEVSDQNVNSTNLESEHETHQGVQDIHGIVLVLPLHVVCVHTAKNEPE